MGRITVRLRHTPGNITSEISNQDVLIESCVEMSPSQSDLRSTVHRSIARTDRQYLRILRTDTTSVPAMTLTTVIVYDDDNDDDDDQNKKQYTTI